MTEIPREPRAQLGQQLTLIRPPAQPVTPRPVWIAAQRIRGERARQKMSITERDNLRRFYLRVFVDGEEHPPIA